MSRGAGVMVLVILFFDSLNSFPQFPGDIYDFAEIRHSSFSRNSEYSGGAILFMTHRICPTSNAKYR